MVFFSLHPIRWTVVAILGLSIGLALLSDGIAHADLGYLAIGIVLTAVSLLFGFHSIKWGIRLVRGFFS